MNDEFETEAASDGDTGGDTMAERDAGLGDFMIAFSLGALFGAGMALFMAPQSGEETRKDLGKKSKKWKKQAGKKLEEASETLKESGGDWLEDAEELVEDWSSGIADVVEEGIQSIRSAVQDEIERVEKRVGKKKKKGLFR